MACVRDAEVLHSRPTVTVTLFYVEKCKLVARAVFLKKNAYIYVHVVFNAVTK